MRKQRGNLYIFIFAVAICLCSSILLALAATVLKPYKETNARLDIVKNILVVAGKKPGELSSKSSEELLQMYKAEFKPVILDKNNRNVERQVIENELIKLKYPAESLQQLYIFELLKIFDTKLKFLAQAAGMSAAEYDPGYKTLFVYQPGGNPETYIIPIAGPALWGMMYGYVALKPDLNSVKGITFYQHQETPGLGAEVEKPWFTKQFIDKKIFNNAGKFVSVTIAKGKASEKVSAGELQHYVDGVSGATLTGAGINTFLKKDLGKFVEYFKQLNSGQSAPAEEAPQASGSTPDKQLIAGGVSQ